MTDGNQIDYLFTQKILFYPEIQVGSSPGAPTTGRGVYEVAQPN